MARPFRSFLSLLTLGFVFLVNGFAQAAPTTKPSVNKALQTVLKRVDAKALRFFQRGKYPGMSIGVVVDQKLVWSKHLGFANIAKKQRATNRTLYRVASITKVFTTTMLAMMRDAGKVRLDDPLALYLPKGLRIPTDPRGAPHITLRHLATHTSGLAGLPPNLKPIRGEPYHGFSEASILQGLGMMGLDFPVGAQYAYSNLGISLLGIALARKAKRSYATLLQEMLLRPLHMTDSGVVLTPAKKAQLAVGYGARPPHTPMKAWRPGGFAPAASLMSSVRDLARWLALQHRAGSAIRTPVRGGTLRELHTPQRLLSQRKPGSFQGAVGLGWHILPIPKQRGRVVFHNGGVAGFRSFIGFSPAQKVGVIVLTNSFRSPDRLGFQLVGMLAKSLPVRNLPRPSARLRLLMKQICAHIGPKPAPAKLTALFSPTFLTQVPIARIVLMLGSIYGQFGLCQRITWRPTRRARVGFATMTFSKGKQLSLLVGHSAHRDGKLVMIRSMKPRTRPVSKRVSPRPKPSSRPTVR